MAANYVNAVGIIIALTSLMLLKNAKGVFRAGSIFTLLLGIFYVALSMLSFHLIQDSGAIVHFLMEKDRVTSTDYSSAMNNVALWQFAAPAAILSVGANLITAWFLSDDARK